LYRFHPISICVLHTTSLLQVELNQLSEVRASLESRVASLTASASQLEGEVAKARAAADAAAQQLSEAQVSSRNAVRINHTFTLTHLTRLLPAAVLLSCVCKRAVLN
jgi:FtsZ-binding cell division protein ZapB